MTAVRCPGRGHPRRDPPPDAWAISTAAPTAPSGRLRRGRRPGSGRVTLDFGDVGYINSTGIALVVRLLADARRDGRAVRAVGLTPHYREIFRITRLSDFMDIVEGDAA